MSYCSCFSAVLEYAFTKQENLFRHIIIHFCQNIWLLSRDPVPQRKYSQCGPFWIFLFVFVQVLCKHLSVEISDLRPGNALKGKGVFIFLFFFIFFINPFSLLTFGLLLCRLSETWKAAESEQLWSSQPWGAGTQGEQKFILDFIAIQ